MVEKDIWDDSHRLWPLPPSSWKMTQTWNDLLFTHYPINLEVLREIVPEALPLDSYNCVGWIGIVTFRMSSVRLRSFPPIPGTDAFPQVNVRTYINLDGKPGVYFVSLDAANRLAATVARNFFHLPYHYADVTIKHTESCFDFNSKRRSDPQAEWVGNYKPISEPYYALKGTFDEWMAERYCFYTIDNKGMPLRCDVLHSPWLLQAAEADVSRNTLLTTQDIKIEKDNPVFHFSKGVEVRAWPLIPAKL